MRPFTALILSVFVFLSISPASYAQKDKVPAAAPTLTPEQEQAIRESMKLPPGTKIKVDVVNTVGGSVTTKEYGKGKGAAAETEGDKLSDNVTGDAPETTLSGGGSSRGGGVTKNTKATALFPTAVPWANPLFWLGVLLLTGAGGLFLFKSKVPFIVPKDLPLVMAGAGAGCLAAAFYPAILLWVFLGIVAFLVVPYVISKAKQAKAQEEAEKAEAEAKRQNEALRAVAAAVDDPKLSEAARREVKERVATHADDADKATITEVRMSDKLGKFA